MREDGEEPPAAECDERGAVTPPTLEVTIADVRVFLPSRPLTPNPLVTTAPHGIRREDEVLRRASGVFSSAFVFRLPPVQKGRAHREPGDGVIVVGPKALVLQSKFRNVAAPDSLDRARAWVEAETERAARQLRGTVRTLRAASANLRLHPVDPPAELANLVFEVIPGEIEGIVGVLIVNHDQVAPGVARLPRVGGDIPFIRTRQEEWDYIVTVWGSATRLVEYVETLAEATTEYGAQRDDFARTDVGRSHQPFPVVDPPGIPSQPGHLGTYQLPFSAIPSNREVALDRLFRAAVFESLLFEAMIGGAQKHAAHRAALALVDGIDQDTRRQLIEKLQTMWAAASPMERNLQRHVVEIGSHGQLVHIVCPDPANDADRAAWTWIEESHAEADTGEPGFSTVGTRWVRAEDKWIARTIVITSRG